MKAALVVHKSLMRIMTSKESKAVEEFRGGFSATLGCENRGKDWVAAPADRGHRR